MTTKGRLLSRTDIVKCFQTENILSPSPIDRLPFPLEFRNHCGISNCVKIPEVPDVGGAKVNNGFFWYPVHSLHEKF